MGKWVIGKIHIDREVQYINKEKLPLKTNPAKDGIFDFPLFHHSIIPCARQKLRPWKTPLFLVSCTNSKTINYKV